MTILRHLAPALALLALSSLAPAATHTVGSGCDFTTLAGALGAAQDGDRIELRSQTFTNVNININRSLEFQGGYSVCGDALPDINGLTILEGDPNGADSVIEIVGSGHTVELKRIEIRGGTDDADNGGGIQVDGGNELRLAGVTITGNSSDIGAGIYLDAGATLRHTGPLTISLNDAQGEGGGIYAGPGALIDFTTGGFNSIDIHDNDALSGAGIYLDEAAELRTDSMRSLSITSGQAFSGGGIWAASNAIIDAPKMFIGTNEALQGGGIYIEGGGTAASSTTVQLGGDVDLRNNFALDGGGIYLAAGGGWDVALDGIIRFNEATRNGAGLYADGSGGGKLVIDALFTSNVADQHGGGLYLKDGSFISGGFASNGNTAQGDGGGLYLDGTLLHQMDSWLIVRSNVAGVNGGGFALVNGSELILERTGPPTTHLNYTALIQSNQAQTGNGGGVHAIDSTVFLQWPIIGGDGLGNEAPLGHGGGLYIDTSLNWSLDNFKVNGNVAGGFGGGIHATGGGNYGLGALVAALPADSPTGAMAACDSTALDPGEYCSELRGNSADRGGGLYAENDPTTVAVLKNTAVLENHASVVNGIRFNDGWKRLENLLFANNGLDNGQLTLALGAGSSELRHVTLADNEGGVSSSVPVADVQIENSLFWNNGPNPFNPPSQTPATGGCNLSSDPDVPGAMDLDPVFVETARGPYRLGPGSEAIDACSSVQVSSDLDGAGRPIGGAYDMGAFEADIVTDQIFSDRFGG